MPAARGLQIVQERSTAVYEILVRQGKAMTFLSKPAKEENRPAKENGKSGTAIELFPEPAVNALPEHEVNLLPEQNSNGFPALAENRLPALEEETLPEPVS